MDSPVDFEEWDSDNYLWSLLFLPTLAQTKMTFESSKRFAHKATMDTCVWIERQGCWLICICFCSNHGFFQFLNTRCRELFDLLMTNTLPCISIMSIKFKILVANPEDWEVSFQLVFVAKPRTSNISLATIELAVHELLWYSTIFHASNVTCPAKLWLDEKTFYSTDTTKRKEVCIGYPVFKNKTTNIAKTFFVEYIKLLILVTIRCPCLGWVQ